jgi:hypothetical protein
MDPPLKQPVMVRLSVILVLEILLSGLPQAAAQPWREPFVMDRIRLGQSLAEFRRLTFVDERVRQELEVICSDAPSAARLGGLRLTSSDRPGALRCGLFERRADADRRHPR